MGREIVENDVDGARPRLRVHDALPELDEVVASVARRGLADQFAGTRVQCGVQRERAMPVVLEAVALRATGRQRQHGVEPIGRAPSRTSLCSPRSSGVEYSSPRGCTNDVCPGGLLP